MSPPFQRAQPRVAYPADVRLYANANNSPVVARSRDLGPTGMFVETGERLGVGTAVICEIALPSGQARLTGLVAREQALPRDTGRIGLGIKFINIDDGARHEIEGLIPLDERQGQLVSVHLDGVKDALRSQAALTPDGLQVTTTLPFLREGGEVKVAFLSGTSRIESRGLVRNVLLREATADGSPRLELRLQFVPNAVPRVEELTARALPFSPRPTDAETRDDEDEKDGEHEDVTEVTAVDTPSGLASGTLGEILARDRAVTGGRRTPTGKRRPIPLSVRTRHGLVGGISTSVRIARVVAVLAAALFLMAVGAALNRFGLARHDRQDRPDRDSAKSAVTAERAMPKRVPSAASQGTETFPGTATPPPTAQAGLPSGTAAATNPRTDPAGASAPPGALAPTVGEARAPAAVAAAELTKPPAPAAQQADPVKPSAAAPLPAEEPSKPPAQAAPPIAVERPVQRAVSPSTLAAPAERPAPSANDSVPSTVPIDRARPAAPVARPNLPSSNPPSEPTAAGGTAPNTTGESAPNAALLERAPANSASTPSAAAAQGIETLPQGTPGPSVARTGNEIVAEVPLDGSTAGAVHYALTQPRGLAIDLPNAKSTLPLGRHPVFNEGFRFISIRERPGGGIRVAFTYAYYTPKLVDVKIEEQAVRIRVEPQQIGN